MSTLAPAARSDSRWRAADAGRWLVGPPPQQAPRLRLLCIPHAGGAPSAFRPWGALVPADVELLVAQLPGRESRYSEPALEDLADAAGAIAAALAPLPPLPLLVFGHSMGALIGYELAQRLQAAGDGSLRLLAVSGHGSPLDPRQYDDLPDTTADDFALEIARRYGGVPAPLLADPQLLQFFLPLLRADFRLVASHRPRPRPPLACAVLALGGDADPHLDADTLARWQDCAGGTFAHRVFPGDHFYLSSQPEAVLNALWRAWPDAS